MLLRDMPIIVTGKESVDNYLKKSTSQGRAGSIVLAAFILFFTAGCGGDVFQTLREPAAIRENGGAGTPAPEYLCVSTSGNDVTGDGSESLPFATFQKAVEAAEETGADEIRVAVGDYEVSATFGIQLFNGLRLFGGYNPTDWTRHPYQTKADRDTHTTTLTYTGSFSGLSGHPSRVIDSGDAYISSSTIIEGFTLKGKVTGDYVSAIYCSEGASPVIRHNTIYGGGSSSVVTSYGIYTTALASPAITGNYISGGDGVVTQGIYNSYSSPDISDNTIYGGDASTNSSYAVRNVGDSVPSINGNDIDGGKGINTYGIHNSSASPEIYNNAIYGGEPSTTNSFGIYNTGSSPKIFNNDIDAGNGKQTTYGISNNSASSPLIYNNTIYGGDCGGGRAYGIFNVNTGTNPVIYNNTICSGTIADTTTLNRGAFAIRDQDQVVKPVIVNNILFAVDTNKTCGMSNFSTNTTIPSPAQFNNNDIFNCVTLYSMEYGSTTVLYTDIADVNALAYADNNVSVDPAFTDQAGGDWHLTASTPASVYDGGEDLSATFTDDMDGITRSWWSMGAYEWVSP